MHYIRLTLVLAAFVLTAVPAQAAQECEAEIQELMSLVAAGAKMPYIYPSTPTTRAKAVEHIRDYQEFICDPKSVIKQRQDIAKKANSLKQTEEKYSRMSPEEFNKSVYGGNHVLLKNVLLGYHAVLAEDKLTLCATEANNAKKCKGSNAAPGKSDTASGNSPSTDRTSVPGPKPAPVTAASSSSKQPKEKKYHYPEYVATECLSLIKEKTLYGGFINSCPFKVAYGWCVEDPKKGGWSESAACGNETRGAGQVVGAKSSDGQHTKGGKKVHWVACMYEDRNGNFLDVGPRDVSWDGQKRQMKFRCGDLMPRK